MRLIDLDAKEPYLLDGRYSVGIPDNAPTVEPERPKGEWVGNAFNEHQCNRCGHPTLWEEEPDDYYEVQGNFCPNCGADMRGKKDD